MGELLSIARKQHSRASMEEVSSARVTQSDGIEGDCRGGGSRKRQVTLLSSEAWTQVCTELDVKLPWTTRRANLLVVGVELPRRVGAQLSIGELRLEVGMETAPCAYMDEQHDGLRGALTPDWRGGVACRVLNDATIQVGDSVSVQEGQS